MLVRMLHGSNAGSQIDVEDHIADAWLNAGRAELVDGGEVDKSVKSAPKKETPEKASKSSSDKKIETR